MISKEVLRIIERNIINEERRIEKILGDRYEVEIIFRERNPAEFCKECDKYLGFKGFCSKDCHDKFYDAMFEVKE